MKQIREKENKAKRMREKNEQADRARREKMERDAQARKQEEEESLNKMEGSMAILLDNLQTNTTQFEVSVSGMELGP